VTSDKRGTKRQCLNCGMKYYDLNRDPILCPGCQTPYVDPTAQDSSQSKAPEDKDSDLLDQNSTQSVEIDPGAKIADAEIVSFEDVEIISDQDDASVEEIPDVEGVDDIGGEVDNVFVETDEDEKIDFVVNTAKDDE